MEAIIHWMLDHLPNVSSVVIIVRSILCFQYVGHSTHKYLRVTLMALSSPPSNHLSPPQYKPHTFYYPTPLVPDHGSPCSDHQRTHKNWRTSSNLLSLACLWFSGTRMFTSVSSSRTCAAELEIHFGTSDRLKTAEIGNAFIFGADRLVKDFNTSLQVAIIFFGMLFTFPYYDLRRNLCTTPSNRLVIGPGWSYRSCSLTIFMNQWWYSLYPV